MLLEQLLAELKALLAERKRPGHLYVVNIRELPFMADKLGYTLALPPKSAPDVVKRKLSVKIGDADAAVTELAPEAVQHEIIVDQDSAVHVELVDVDDGGLESPLPSVLDFVAVDTIAPPQPGEMGVASVREIAE